MYYTQLDETNLEPEVSLPRPDVRRIPPTIVVCDLDNTLLWTDEERITSTTFNAIRFFVRRDISAFITYLRRFFAEKVFFVLWSAGVDDYVLQATLNANLSFAEFNVILGARACEASMQRYGVSKSPRFLYRNVPQVREWIEQQVNRNGFVEPVFVLIDDRGRENGGDEYPFLFMPKPIDLKTIDFEKLEASTEHLIVYAVKLVDCLIWSKQQRASFNGFDEDETTTDALSYTSGMFAGGNDKFISCMLQQNRKLSCEAPQSSFVFCASALNLQ